MIQEKRLRLAVLLLQGLTVDEAQELTSLLIEEREEWYVKKEHKKDEVQEPDKTKWKFNEYEDNN